MLTKVMALIVPVIGGLHRDNAKPFAWLQQVSCMDSTTVPRPIVVDADLARVSLTRDTPHGTTPGPEPHLLHKSL